RLIRKQLVGGPRIEELPEISLARGISDVLHAVREPGEVEPIAVEQYQGGIAFAALMSLDVSVLHDEEGAAFILYDLALLRDQSDPLLRVALIVDQDALQLSIGQPFANVKRQPLLQLRE